MAYEQRNNNGSLFKNDRKSNDRQPDYNGNAVINGKPMRISAWIRKSQNGTTFMSLAFEDANGAYQQPQGGGAPQYNPKGMQQTGQFPATPVGDIPNDIPF